MKRRPKNRMLHVNITDEKMLYNNYLSFLKNGGLFCSTEKPHKLGDEVILLLTLLDGRKTPVAGEVAWINPKGAQGGRPAGIGVHFGEVDEGKTRTEIENKLAGRLKLDKRTHTM